MAFGAQKSCSYAAPGLISAIPNSAFRRVEHVLLEPYSAIRGDPRVDFAFSGPNVLRVKNYAAQEPDAASVTENPNRNGSRMRSVRSRQAFPHSVAVKAVRGARGESALVECTLVEDLQKKCLNHARGYFQERGD